MKIPLRATTIPILSIALLVGGTSAVLARPSIPEPQVESGGNRQVIHIRTQGGCDGVATDRLEVSIPESVVGVAPEAIPGWTIETEEVTTEPYDLFGESLATRIGTVRWLGSLADEQFLDLGIAGVFREAGDLVFPVLQGCGDTEIAWTEVVAEGQEPGDVELRAPTLAVVEPTDPVDLPALQATVDELQQNVTTLQEELTDMRTAAGDLRVPALRGQVEELRQALEDLQARVDEIEGAAAP